MQKFTLINPYIGDDFERTFKGKTSIDAAQSAWEGISEHIFDIPEFFFTMSKGKKLYHFKVSETIEGSVESEDDNADISYSIRSHDVKLTKEATSELWKQYSKMKKQSGGKRKKDSETEDPLDDSSDSDDMYNRLHDQKYIVAHRPTIGYWSYDPIIYRVPKIYMPTFLLKPHPLSPQPVALMPLVPRYVKINLSSAFFI
jgi:hypothetical protein